MDARQQRAKVLKRNGEVVMVADEPIVIPCSNCRRRLGLKHALHVRAAEYWLALGNVEEAAREVRKIQWSRRKHPDVRQIQEKIEVHAQFVKTVIRDDCILEPYWDFE
jgi:hypothetical protein